jgi:uncharacterized protein
LDSNFFVEEALWKKLEGFSYLKNLVFLHECDREKALLHWEKKGLFYKSVYAQIREALYKRDFPQLTLKWLGDRVGFGLFALQDIPSFTLIGEYTGIVRKKPWESPRKNRYYMQYPIGFWSLSSWVVDAKEQGNYCRFINHAQVANVFVKSFVQEGLMRLAIITSKKIYKGDQLLLNYGDLYWKQLKEKPLTLPINEL